MKIALAFVLGITATVAVAAAAQLSMRNGSVLKDATGVIECKLGDTVLFRDTIPEGKKLAGSLNYSGSLK